MSIDDQFWQWFKQNEEVLFHFERDQEKTFDRLSAALRLVDKVLTFEFGPEHGGKREFVVSAGGLKTAFPAVRRLYESRPELRRFNVTAFRPRRQTLNDIECGELKINISDVRCCLCNDDDPNKIGLLLFLPGFSESRNPEFRQIGYLFLDESLGEYDVEMKVGFIEIMGCDSRYVDNWFPIQELAATFDATFKHRMNKGVRPL